jgi:hypothetical protein
LAHNKHIRDIVPKENLLEVHPKDGWAPLCKFLGKETPKESYPNVNTGGSVTRLMKAGIIARLISLSIMPRTAIGAVVWAWYVWA